MTTKKNNNHCDKPFSEQDIAGGNMSTDLTDDPKKPWEERQAQAIKNLEDAKRENGRTPPPEIPFE